MTDYDAPTYENQLTHARALLADKGPAALKSPHVYTGRQCRCGGCFTCAAAQVYGEWQAARERAYDRGEYTLAVPDVTTGRWNRRAWINWVRFNDPALRGFDNPQE